MHPAALEMRRLKDLVSDIATFETDYERNLAHFSPGLCAILGVPVGTEMTLSQAARLFDIGGHPAAQPTSVAVDKGRWNGIFRVLRPDGAVRWVCIEGRRFYRDSPDGLQPVRSIGVVVDVSDLKGDEPLRESERRLELALDAGRMGTFEADVGASYALIDAQEAQLLDLPEETRVVSIDELRKRVPIEDLVASDAKQQRLTEAGEPYHHEFRLRLHDGSERWLSAYADIRENRIFGVNLDITERKLAEVALQESEARLRIATSGAALGVFEWHPTTDYAIWENDRVYEIFGRSRADGPLSKRQFIAEYLHEDDVAEFDAALHRAMLTDGILHAVCRIRIKGGAQRWLQIDGKFEPATASKPARLVGMVADITTRKKLEARAKRLAERLLVIQEEERRSIAQELHDSTVQHLVAADLALTTLLAHLGEQGHKSWDDAEASLAEAMKELRTFSYLMYPPTLRTQGLRLSLQQYIDGFADRSSIACRFKAKFGKLPLRIQRAIFRIVQEALANVYRHASASQASIELRRMGACLHVIITDNGRGIGARGEPDKPNRPGIGIRGMGMRLKRLGGRLRISEPPAGGTRIHAVLPVGA